MNSRAYFRKRGTLRIIYLIVYAFLGVYSHTSKAATFKNDNEQWLNYQSTMGWHTTKESWMLTTTEAGVGVLLINNNSEIPCLIHPVVN